MNTPDTVNDNSLRMLTHSIVRYMSGDIEGLVQERRNSSALATKLRLFFVLSHRYVITIFAIGIISIIA